MDLKKTMSYMSDPFSAGLYESGGKGKTARSYMSDPFLLACTKVEQNEVLHERPFSAGLYESGGKTRSYMSDPFLLVCVNVDEKQGPT